MKMTILIIFLIIFMIFYLEEPLYASSLNTYFFAYGQDEEINIFWDYCGEENLLGCHLLRSETFGGEYLQVNDNLITSPDTDFSFQDTSSIIDTFDYFYKINYIWQDSTFTELYPIFSLKQITFEIVNPNLVEVYLEMRKNRTYGYNHYASWDNIIWDVISSGVITVYYTMLIDPYTFPGNYLQMEFLDLGSTNPDLGHFKLSMDYLISIIAGSDINDEIIPESTNILYQNYPNPFNPTTTIEFSISEESNVELSIFNIKGQKITTIADNEFTIGSHSIIWNGDDNNKPVASGIYYYKLTVNGKTEVMKKCLLLK